MSNWKTEINKYDNVVALDEQNWQKNKTELADLSSGVKDDSTFLSENRWTMVGVFLTTRDKNFTVAISEHSSLKS